MIFYVDRQQPAAPPPEVHDTVTVKNLANLNKGSLKLLPVEGTKKYRLTFRCDTAAPATVRVHFAAAETPDPSTVEGQGVLFMPTTKCVFPEAQIPAETDFEFTQPLEQALDLVAEASHLKFSPAHPTLYPLVIALSYEVPPPEEEGEVTAEVPAEMVQSQYTYAEISTSGDEPRVVCLRQRLQLADGSLFDLDDIYGNTADGGGEPSGEVEEGEVAVDMGMEGDECVICLANDRDTTVMPCRHMCLCGECAEVLRKQTNKCPICRTSIERLMTHKKAEHV